MSAGAFARTSYSSGVSFGVSSLMPTRYPPADACNQRAGRVASGRRWYSPGVFFFFSNRLGCLGSIVLSIVVTVVLLAILSIL